MKNEIGAAVVIVLSWIVLGLLLAALMTTGFGNSAIDQAQYFCSSFFRKASDVPVPKIFAAINELWNLVRGSI
jgi:hypothetical protein